MGNTHGFNSCRSICSIDGAGPVRAAGRSGAVHHQQQHRGRDSTKSNPQPHDHLLGVGQLVVAETPEELDPRSPLPKLVLRDVAVSDWDSVSIPVSRTPLSTTSLAVDLTNEESNFLSVR